MPARLIGLGILLAAAVFAATAVAFAGWTRPDAGVVVTGGVSSRVDWVLAGGPAWRDDVRPGQMVVELVAGVNPSTWRMVTTDGVLFHATSYVGHEAALRETLVAAAAGAALAAAGWLLVRHLPLASAVAVLSLALASVPIMASGYALFSSIGAVVAVLAPAVWLATFFLGTRRARAVPLVLAAVVAGVWVVARAWAPPVFDASDVARQTTMAGGLVAMVILLADPRRWRGRFLALESQRAADLTALVTIVAIAVLAALVVEMPPSVLIVAAFGVLLLYPRFRRRLALAIDQIVLGDIRHRASLQAVEEERGRIARDLHDEPLQEIAAVIRRLDSRPDVAVETDILRNVSGRLRQITTELRPPVLDDLGLRAAISYVADQAASVATDAEVVALVEPSDPIVDRPPADVELAVFRIVQEAADNAVRHARAQTIEIRALVTATEVDAVVQDDGVGIDEGSQREALLAGHVGMASMAQRAALIGADFAVQQARPSGTIVRVHWQAAA